MSRSKPSIRTHPGRLAIVGMEVCFSQYDGLDAYEHFIYEGLGWDPARPEAGSHSGLDGPEEAVPYDAGALLATTNRAVRCALQRAALKDTDRLAIIVWTPGSSPQGWMAPFLSRLTQGFRESWASFFGEEGYTFRHVESIIAGSLCRLISTVQSLLDHSRPGIMTDTGMEGAADAVVVVGLDVDPDMLRDGASQDRGARDRLRSPGAAVLVLQDLSRAALSDRPILARILSVSEYDPEDLSNPHAEGLDTLLESALSAAGKSPWDLGQLEVLADQTISPVPLVLDRVAGVFNARSGSGGQGTRQCAVRLTGDPDQPNSEPASVLALIRCTLGLFRRVIFGYPPQAFTDQLDLPVPSPFYLPVWSRSWFVNPALPDRCAGILDLSSPDSPSMVVVEEGSASPGEVVRLIDQSPILLFPIAGDDLESLNGCLDRLRDRVAGGCDLVTTSRYWIEDVQAKSPAKYAVCLLGRDCEDTLREIQFARKGLEKTWEHSGDWQTPLGSYTTSRPLGGQGEVAFVYPGAFNSYPGIGKDLLYLFPSVFDTFSGITGDIGNVLRETYLYPRTSGGWNSDRLQELESHLSSDSISMLTSGSGMAVIYTLILQDIFHLKPRYAFGYSLGESSMLYAMQIWREGDAGASVLASTPLFRSRLSGSKEAVRDYWLQKGVPYHQDEVPWANYVLMADPQSLQDRILSYYPYVFLTHINAPRQVVIAGEPDHCQALIKQVNAPSLRAPFDHVLHCDAMAAEYNEITRISTWEVHPNTDVMLYSAGNYAPLNYEKDAIAASIATALTSTLDFPRLVQRVYDDGARIFVEVGAGSNCSKWIDETLKQQDHASFAVNRRGTDDTTSLVRLLARLISHRVPLSLSSMLSTTRID